MKTIIGIEASRNRSGGAIVHLQGILGESNPVEYGIKEVHIWSYKKLLDVLPDYHWLVKHNPKELESSLISQVWWQYRKLPKEADEVGCQVMFNTDAGSVCPFRPSVVMSQDLLSYEKGEINRYKLFSYLRIRIWLLKFVQVYSLSKADGAIFLSYYASDLIQKFTKKLDSIAIIPHGVSADFKRVSSVKQWPYDGSRPIDVVYVSNTEMYKHHWHVVDAIGLLIGRGHKIKLHLIGGEGPGEALLNARIKYVDPNLEFVNRVGYVEPKELPKTLANMDIFVFASSCENLPNTLIEGMAVGLPIACSNRGPMPEILGEKGIYFDPENIESIASAVEVLLKNANIREESAKNAKELSGQYSWHRCGNETWEYIVDTIKRSNGE